MAEPEDKNAPYPPYASLVLRGKDLDPQKITDALGIPATYSFRRGDQRKNNKKWPHGLWMLDSKEQIHSVDLTLHITWILEKVEPVQAQLFKMIKEQSLDADISCFWIMPTSNERLIFEPELMKRIVLLNLVLDIDVYTPS